MKSSLFARSLVCSCVLCGFSATTALGGDATNKSEVVRYRDRAQISDVAAFLEQNDTKISLEFVAGDKIPLAISGNSDVFELDQSAQPHNFVVKTGFLLKFGDDHNPLISFDGNNYMPLHEAFKGSMGVSTGAVNGTANRVSLVTFIGELSRKK
jgi:ABC-type glycerol-3-phosphate transport system substrate-binding protein